jgi:periplasmic mercuric ion binding protein
MGSGNAINQLFMDRRTRPMLRLKTLVLGATAFMLASAAQAADVKVTGLHACCGNCANTIKPILEKEGATNVMVKTGPMAELSFTAAEPVKALTALRNAGFYTRAEGVRVPGQEGVRDLKAKELKISDVHNCCGACTAALNKALAPVGKATVAAKQTAITVTSDSEIEGRALIQALHQAGFHAKIAK